jgi:DNA polymerase
MVRIGMLGNEGVLFGREVADALMVSLDSFTARNYSKALDSKPSNLTENEHLLHCACAKEIIDRYRGANAAIVKLWRDCQGIIPALAASENWDYVIGREPVLKVIPGGIVMPNGLVMQYNGLKQHDGGEWSLTKRRGRKLERNKVYGGLIAENLTQCLARIVITEAMNKMTRAGLKLVLQVHDEVVACSDTDQAEADFALMQRIMAERPAWAPSLPLASEGGVDERYVK